MQIDLNRRKLLQTGTASILIAGGATACQPAPASGPWEARTDLYTDIRLRVLSSAILAPSPHNRQPWLIDLDESEPKRLTLYPDLSRLLPETDPPNRQILIGLGAFLEAFGLAASEEGCRAEIEPYPEGVDPSRLDARPIAHICLIEDRNAQADPLFPYLRQRRTNRAPFKAQPVPKDDVRALGTALNTASTFWGGTSDPDLCATLRDLCREGWLIESATPRTHLESVALTRIGRREIEANPDGISLSGGMIGAYAALGILSRDAMKDPESRAALETVKFYNGLIDSARSFGWLATSDNDRLSQLDAGRDWLRVHLAATRGGLAFQPLSQTLQEFPEMTSLYEAVHQSVSIRAPSRIQGLFRIGYAKAPEPSPRWALQTRLIDMPD